MSESSKWVENSLSESVKKKANLGQMFFSDNVEWSSKNLLNKTLVNIDIDQSLILSVRNNGMGFFCFTDKIH